MVKVSKTGETCDAPPMASARIFAVIAVSMVMLRLCAVSSVAAQVKMMRRAVGRCIFGLLSHCAQTGGFATNLVALVYGDTCVAKRYCWIIPVSRASHKSYK